MRARHTSPMSSTSTSSTIRRHRRVALRGRTISADMSIEGQPPVTGRITVLGAGGAFVEVSSRIEPSSAISLRFTLPGTLTEIICTGVVRDSVIGGVGVEFTQISSSERELVDSAVRRLEHRPGPTPRP